MINGNLQSGRQRRFGNCRIWKLFKLLNITMFLLDMDKYIKCMMSYILIIIIQKLMR